MIGLHSLFAILWILPTIAIQLPIYSSRDSPIDWSGCGSETKCFCLNGDTKIAQLDTGVQKASGSTSKSDEGRCNIGVQNKFFTVNLAVFQLQIIGDEIELGADPQLMLILGNEPLFGCKLDSKSGKYELAGNLNELKKFKIEVVQDRTRFQAGNAICALKIERVSKLRTSVNGLNVNAILKLTTEYKFDLKGVSFLDSSGVTCDPFSFKSPSPSMNYHVQPLKNIDRKMLNCEEYDSSLYTLRYANLLHQDVEIKSLACVPSPSGYSFQVVKVNGNKEIIAEPDQYSFYCAANIEKICQDPIRNCTTSEINKKMCPKYKNSTETGGNATLTCPDKKWIINGEYLELDIEPVCKRDSMKKDEAAFHTLFHSRYEEKTSNSRCFKDYDCYKKSKLQYSDCKKESCGVVVFRNGIMKCNDTNKRLIIELPASNEALSASSYKCDKKTGRWIDRNGTSLPDNTRVTCPGEPKRSAPIVDMTVGEMVGYILGVVAASIGLALLVSVAVYCYYFKPKIFVEKGKRGWLKTKTAEQITYSKDLFGKVTQSTIDTPYRIVHGFNLLDLLLDTDTFEPKIWEDVDMFLMRFQGAIEKVDHNITKMFMRYMFLQAKKIIDKHGWISEKPITKTNKNRSGLMRSVAIRLLSFSINSPDEDAAERFALSGFRKLGFKAVDQYPHCGELWPLLFHDRILASCKSKKNLNIRLFDREKFTEVIQEIAFNATIDMPEEDIIPEFGSPSDQAAFAVGGSPNTNVHSRIVNGVWNSQEVKSVSREKYFAGMSSSLGRNPSSQIIYAFNMSSEVNKEFLENLPKRVNESEWNKIIEKTMKIMVYYGRSLDAKRLQVRFMPSVPQPSELYSQLKMDQQFFEEAVEQQIGELRKWFAERTDKEEIKKAPVYTKDAELEARIYVMMQKARERAVVRAAEVETEPVSAPAAPAAPPVTPAAAPPEQKP